MTWTRRDLLKAAGLASAGLAVPALARPALAGPGGAALDALRVPSIPAVGALDDALALYAYAAPMPARFAGAVLNHSDLVRTASLLPATPPDAVALLDAFRADHDAEGAAEKAAFGAGWLAHRAALSELGGAASDEAAVYRAAEVLRDRGRGGAGSADDVEALFDAMWHRTMIRLHTLKPDDQGVEAWMGRFVAWRREAEARARALAEAVATPDPAARRRYTAGFYDPADPVVALARTMERHELTAPPPIRAALAAPGASAYACAAAAAARTLLQATAYVDGTAAADDLVALR